MAHNDEGFNILRQMLDRDRDIQRKILNEKERKMMNDYRDSYQAPSAPTTSYTSKFPQPDLKIDVLTDENKLLKEKYSVLLKKTNMIVDAYRKLEAKNKLLKTKKDKRESWEKRFSNVRIYVNNVLKKIIVWFST